MFTKRNDQIRYILENYPAVTDSRIDDNHFDIFCPTCSVVRGFQVVERGYATETTGYHGYSIDLYSPKAIHFRCPVCKSYKMWLVFNLNTDLEQDDGSKTEIKGMYKVTSIPSDGLQEIDELPEEPKTLRIAYRQAIRAMDANAYLAAAAMFRRALQIITRDILKVTPGMLANELKSAVGKAYNGANLTNDFANKGYIIKEAGNQGAHPDKDPDLLDFTEQDAKDLQDIFMELVADLFIVPKAKAQSRAQFLQRRKISNP